ncbi:MAG: hypothetical protein K2Z81_12990 [Cyanobacteria bacterium]|nr:hypothetical protein [Cyanobacteriota bacterium]
MGLISYALCAVTSLICFILLMRGFLKDRNPLLLWSSFCFGSIAVQNSLLFCDLVLIPEVSLVLARTLIGFIGQALLLCALIWEH